MPRIRTLKPEIHQHRKVGPLSDRQFRVWVGLITQADDEGRFVADADALRATLFAYHPRVRARHVRACLDHLAGTGLISLYEAGGVPYGVFGSWADHQRIHKHHFTPSRLPAPPAGTGTVPVPQARGTSPAGSDRIGSGSGSDRKGEEGNGQGTPESSSLSGSGATEPLAPAGVEPRAVHGGSNGDCVAGDPQRGDYAAVVARIGARMTGSQQAKR